MVLAGLTGRKNAAADDAGNVRQEACLLMNPIMMMMLMMMVRYAIHSLCPKIEWRQLLFLPFLTMITSVCSMGGFRNGLVV